MLIKKLLSVQAVRYLISSGAAVVVDYALHLVLEAALRPSLALAMELSAVIAFLVSSQINFWINRIWVFKSEKSPLPELGGYYSLAVVSFLLRTFVLLEIFVRFWRLPLSIAKIIAEIIKFAINLAVQKMVIFRRKG